MKINYGNFLEVQWLRLSAFTAGAWVQSLVGELRPCMLCGMVKNKQIKTLQNLQEVLYQKEI